MKAKNWPISSSIVGTKGSTILDRAAEEVAYIAYFIEAEGLPKTSKKFIDDVFLFFQRLGDSRMKHKPCRFHILEGGGLSMR